MAAAAPTTEPTTLPPFYELPADVEATLRPAPDLGIIEWCERFRFLQEKHAADPGAFSLARTPYLREVYESFADPDVGTLILIKPSRCGGTEFLNNLLAWSVDCRPMPTMYVLPREEDVAEEFRGRIKGIFETSPRLAAHVPGGNWSSDGALHLDTMSIIGAPATAVEGFLRRTTGVNLFDEVDNCAKWASRLGDIWTLLQERITTFGYRGKQVGVTTPTTEDASGWRAYQRSDRRRFFIPCPRCGAYDEPTFDRLRWPADARDPDLIEFGDLAWYECAACGGTFKEAEKAWSVDRGVWVPHTQQIDQRLDLASPEVVERSAAIGPARWRPRLKGERPITRNRGFWLHGCLVSPWRKLSAIAAKFLRVKDHPLDFKVFVNSWKAEPWAEAAQATAAEELAKLSELGLPCDVVPDRAVLLLAGADVQGNRVHYVVQAYGPNEECWLIRPGICETLDELVTHTIRSRFKRADGTEDLAVSFVAVDSGHRTAEVYDLATRWPGEVLAVKGRDRLDEKWRPASIEYTPAGARKPQSVKLYHVNTGFFKEKLHGLARRQPGQLGEWHLPRDVSAAFLEQFCSEHQVYERPNKKRAKGRWVWKQKAEGKANHYLDCMVYVSALADLKNVRALRPREVLAAERARAELARANPAPRPGLRTPDGRPFLATNR